MLIKSVEKNRKKKKYPHTVGRDRLAHLYNSSHKKEKQTEEREKEREKHMKEDN